MSKPGDKSILISIVYILYSALVICWLVGLLPTPAVGDALVRDIGGDPALGVSGVLVLVALVVVWVLAVWNLVSRVLMIWIPRFTRPGSAIMLIANLLLSGIVAFFLIAHLQARALSAAYFQAEHWPAWILGGISILYNAWNLFGIIGLFGRHDETWGEYQGFREKLKAERGNAFDRLTRWGIQRRLVVSFVAIIFIIIGFLSWTLLNDFSSTILASVRESGLNLAERTASVIKTNIVDPISIDDYLRLEAQKNSTSAYPFKQLECFLVDKASGHQMVRFSTHGERTGMRSPEDSFRPDTTRFLEHDQGSEIEFVAPVTLGGKYLGYVSAVYDRDKILEPYFRTQIKVWVIAGIFIYLSVFLTYLFGRNIVIPILFLRMSVSAIASTLEEMIKGTRRISSDTLQYKDRVGTRDEIKGLSTEIGNMTTVIKGVIPYISAATLMNAEKGISSEERDLAFLFTDIRGFTSLCEGMAPAEVVNLLNYYLDLQTSVILANHGDVDKFVGDEIMAMFDGPDKEINACRAGLEIRAAMAEAQAEARSKSGKVVEIGLGINAGPVVFGSVGSRDRMDFTSIGDTVNLAARLEGANKNYGTRSLISETVYDKVKTDFLCREIDLITVVGKKQPVRIYEILGEKGQVSQEERTLAKRFAEALEKYRAQDWDASQAIFFPLWKEANDEAAAVFLKRIDLFRKAAPEPDWDGVFALTIK